jgi:hypothetical protein
MLYVVGAYMFIARVGRTARIPADEVDPESALAAATEMIANHRVRPLFESAAESDQAKTTIIHHSSAQ